MAKQFSVAYQIPPIGLIPPQAQSSLTSPYKSLRNCAGKVTIIAHVNQGNAATVTLTPLQATSSAGAGSKAIGTNGNAFIFYNSNTTLADTLVVQAAGVAFTTDASLADKLVIFEFDPADCLDMVNGFNHIALQMNAGNAANIVEAHMEYLGRFQQQAPPASEV